GDADDDDAVHDRAPEVRPVHRVAEVVERRVDREPRRRQAVDVVRRLERRREHPVDGEDHHDEDREGEQVPAEPAEPLLAPAARRRRCGDDRAHLTSAAFTIWRTYPTLRAATITSISS